MRRLDGMRSYKTDGWRAFHITVNWAKESFAASGGPFDYTKLRESTEQVIPMLEERIDFVNLYI
jgi:hypothetical protein